MGYFTGKRILIIGGTGIVGHGLINELLKENPNVIKIFSRDGCRQFLMQNEYGYVLTKFKFSIGDIRDCDRVESVMKDIDIVFNLAEMKNILLCESNPFEAIKTNVFGLENVLKSAIKCNVKCVVHASSAMAANPIDIYGTTKLLGEKLVQSINYINENSITKFITVRFGKIMDLQEPFLKSKIKEDGMITVPGLNKNRFVITLNRLVKLMLKVVKDSAGGETFVFKMPVARNKDLAKILVEEISKKLNLQVDSVKIKEADQIKNQIYCDELMTKEESITAYDLGYAYAIISPRFYEEGSIVERYNMYKKAENKSYNSLDIEPITIEELRRLLTCM